jgi:hypothetical protein
VKLFLDGPDPSFSPESFPSGILYRPCFSDHLYSKQTFRNATGYSAQSTRAVRADMFVQVAEHYWEASQKLIFPEKK